uniref:Retrovirus-related Pol polyprotein from transposon TNT 1-94 n=1 Tax=Tanacetum cinerariifolium TaxID=118510 RepID=A0A699GN53_TANCI|nr:hypothetical protein [Tanacetum cinerariifolium]
MIYQALLCIIGDYDDALVCCVENTVKDRIMDSGASFHATYYKEELDRFRLRSSKDVRYILGLKRRLILAGQLDKEGYHVGFGDQQWKVTKGSLVVARGNKHGSLYMVEKAIALHLMHQSKDLATMILLSKTAAGVVVVKDACGEDMKCTFIGIDSDEMRHNLGIRRVTRLFEVEILHLWTRFMEPEHGLSSEITQSLCGSSDTSEWSKNSRSFKDSGRSDEE